MRKKKKKLLKVVERKLLHALIHDEHNWWEVEPNVQKRNRALHKLEELGLIEIDMERGMRATARGRRSNEKAIEHGLVTTREYSPFFNG